MRGDHAPYGLIWFFVLLRPLIQIVLSCPCWCACSAEHRGVGAVELGFDPAVVAHADQFGVVGVGEHGMFALQFLNNTLNSGFYAERFAALDTLVRFFFVNYVVGQGGCAKVQLWNQRDRVFGASADADSALQARVFFEAQLWHVGIVAKCAGGAEAGAG